MSGGLNLSILRGNCSDSENRDLNKIDELAVKSDRLLDSPEQGSPNSPLTRLYLNVLYIAVPDAPGYSCSKGARDLVKSPVPSPPGRMLVSAQSGLQRSLSLKLDALRVLHAEFDLARPDDRQSFQRFSKRWASACVGLHFQALRQHFAAEDQRLADGAIGRTSPDRHLGTLKSSRRRRRGGHFLTWLQWVADDQLAGAARAADDAGMAIGLDRNMAVGCDCPRRARTNHDAFMAGTQIGAPPRHPQTCGAESGPAALSSHRPAGKAIQFHRAIRADMRNAGGLRIDHVTASPPVLHPTVAARGSSLRRPPARRLSGSWL